MEQPATPAAPDAADAAVAAPEADVSSGNAPKTEAEPTLTLMIDGQEEQLTLSQAKTRLQKQEAADKRFREAAKIQKDAEQKAQEAKQLLEEFEKDPEAVFTKLGKDFGKVTAAHLEKKAKLALMSPEQIEKQRLEDELATFKAKEEASKKEREAKAHAEADAKTLAALERQWLTTAEKFKLDQTPETLELMAEVGLEALELGYEGITPDEIAEEVIRRQAEHVEARDRKVMAKMSPAQLIKYLGPERVQAILAETTKSIPAPKIAFKQPEAKPKTLNTKISEADFLKSLGA